MAVGIMLETMAHRRTMDETVDTTAMEEERWSARITMAIHPIIVMHDLPPGPLGPPSRSGWAAPPPGGLPPPGPSHHAPPPSAGPVPSMRPPHHSLPPPGGPPHPGGLPPGGPPHPGGPPPGGPPHPSGPPPGSSCSSEDEDEGQADDERSRSKSRQSYGADEDDGEPVFLARKRGPSFEDLRTEEEKKDDAVGLLPSFYCD
ncbi:hypothetical protein ANCCEY_12798 [Ancylostoma ceylanicum]|uniref:Uncharacterized protein n=1 Tax=Ancylostoma ceylanicum TaxID=53326 RepID=A0A0D6LKE3_9BILA|nr:hypothetical protein ANCCEY_12798 [Ancylostoma ceylanicum]